MTLTSTASYMNETIDENNAEKMTAPKATTAASSPSLAAPDVAGVRATTAAANVVSTAADVAADMACVGATMNGAAPDVVSSGADMAADVVVGRASLMVSDAAGFHKVIPVKSPELLAPAGNMEKLEIAFAYGADAVYVGGEAFSLRAGAGNFSIQDIEAGTKLAHSLGKRLYVAVNIFAHNRDFDGLPDFLLQLADIGVDALIVSDPGVISLARKLVPSLPLHLSTQANCTNQESARFWEAQGLERIILARELSLTEIRQIRDSVSLSLEAFVHGAMCVSYSGRCLLSSFLTGRSANRGDCAHPCRWEYRLVEEKRPGEYFPVVEEDRGTYILNANDMCMIEHIPELVLAGVDSFKIEGRMKSVHYVATVVKAYREAIDAYLEDPQNWECREEWLEELKKASHRNFSTGFFFGKPGPEDQNYQDSGYIRTHEFVGKVLEYLPDAQCTLIEQRNKFSPGDQVEVFGPGQEPFQLRVESIKDVEGNLLEAASHPKQHLIIPMDRAVDKNFLIRKPL